MTRITAVAALFLVACGGNPGTADSGKGSSGNGTQSTADGAGQSSSSVASHTEPVVAAPSSGVAGGAPPVPVIPASTSIGQPSGASASGSRVHAEGKRPVVRGLYVNRFAAQSRRKMANLIAMADSTEINAFVIDVKDEFGINYKTSDSLIAPNAGRSGAIPNLTALLDTLKAHNIMPIARIVVFKDSVTARVNPQWTIRKADGSAWRDREGLSWVNPYNEALWEYNIRIAEEAARLGFEEIQWDYIRFPEPYKSLPQQVFPGSDGRSKPEALTAFLTEARSRLARLGVASTADIFGLVTTVPGGLEIGQKWEALAPAADVLLPMVYPSHYPRGAFGLERPNAEPYKVIFAAIRKAHERNLAMGLTGETVRPWLQAFTLGQPAYGPEHLAAQKRAVYDAGFDGWVLWHPGSKYDTFASALEPTLESRKKPFTVVTQDVPPTR